MRLRDRLRIPKKDEWYINKRFFSHPVYKYLVWKITGANESGLLVGREVEVNDAKILRIVDFLGNPNLLDGLYTEFRKMLEKNNYEYIDFYVYGIEDAHLENAGFILKTEEDRVIIPNYFEPFDQRNIEIYGTSEISNIRACKADADQDRPNFSHFMSERVKSE